MDLLALAMRRLRRKGAKETAMKQKKILMGIACAALLACAFAQLSACGEPGETDTTFNKKFIPTIKPAMTYEQIVKMVGTAGVKVGENKNASPPTVQYRWKGGKDSILTATFAGNKMIDATVVVPSKHTYHIQSDGKVADITK